MCKALAFAAVWSALLCPYDLSAQSDAVDQAAEQLIKAGAAGFSMAIFDDKGLNWSDARGYSDVENRQPMTADTVFNIASISKTITASSLMLLVEQGKLDLDADINRYLPFKVRHPDYPDTTITTRQLLTHTAAIDDRSDLYNSETSYHTGGDNPIELCEFLDAYFTPGKKYFDRYNFAGYEPATERTYSNIGFGLVGCLVRQVSGTPLNLFSAEHVFGPLAMKSTGWMLSEVDVSHHARLYEWNGQIHGTVEIYGLLTWPDGGLRTSARDLARFYAAIINQGELGDKRILTRATVGAMLAPQFVSGQPLADVEEAQGNQQALAWNYRLLADGPTVLGHSGGDPGVTTHAYYFPDRKCGALLLINTSSDTEPFAQAVSALIRALLQEAAMPEP